MHVSGSSIRIMDTSMMGTSIMDTFITDTYILDTCIMVTFFSFRSLFGTHVTFTMKRVSRQHTSHPDLDCTDSRTNFLKLWFWVLCCTSVAHFTLSGSFLTQWLLLSSVAHHYFTFVASFHMVSQVVSHWVKNEPLRCNMVNTVRRWATELKNCS